MNEQERKTIEQLMTDATAWKPLADLMTPEIERILSRHIHDEGDVRDTAQNILVSFVANIRKLPTVPAAPQ